MYKIVQRKERQDGTDTQQQPQVQSSLYKNEAGVKPISISRRNELSIKSNQMPKANEHTKNTTAANKAPQLQASTSFKKMEASIPLISDGLELLDTIKEYFNDSNKKFNVIAAIGLQGTAKSTTLSMLAGNDPMDMYRQYIFRPCAREAVESCRYQTTKISIFISQKTRVFFLDCQPLNSVPLLEDCTHSYRSKAGPMESLEVESLQLLLLLTNICHTIILCIDWFIDLSVIRRLLRVELFPNFLSPMKSSINLVVLHQRAKPQDFQPLLVAERMKILEKIFDGTIFNIRGGLSMAEIGYTIFEQIGSDINYIVLEELKPRTRADNPQDYIHQKSREFDYGTVVSNLRTKILVTLAPLGQKSTDMTEIKWFYKLIDCWKRLTQELQLMTEDGCTLKRHYVPHTNTEESSLAMNQPSSVKMQEFRRSEMIGPGYKREWKSLKKTKTVGKDQPNE